MPPTFHCCQVTNVGESEGKAVFFEPYPTCKPCGDVDGYISPFTVSPECYKILAEDDDCARAPTARPLPAHQPSHAPPTTTLSTPSLSTGAGITGMLTMEPGAKDEFHHHKNHLIYVLGGEEVTIYPGGDESAAMAVPLALYAGIPAPMEAPPFGSHVLKNTGSVPLKMLFFEAKK